MELHHQLWWNGEVALLKLNVKSSMTRESSIENMCYVLVLEPFRKSKMLELEGGELGSLIKKRCI